MSAPAWHISFTEAFGHPVLKVTANSRQRALDRLAYVVRPLTIGKPAGRVAGQISRGYRSYPCVIEHDAGGLRLVQGKAMWKIA